MDERKAQEPPAEQSLPSPKSTNNEFPSLATTMKRLSLGTAAATELPPSSPINHSSERLYNEPGSLSPAKLRRSPSTTSLGSVSRSGTPTVRKKSSLSSMKGASNSTPPRSPGLRRVSSNLASASQPGLSGPTLEPAAEEPPAQPLTAASVAREFLERDIENHKVLKPDQDLVVIIHDACYGHRFSRPRTSKASLSTIVERPERILATVLGICCAYVRLGSRHVGGHGAPHPEHAMDTIPFKIQKSNRFVPLVSPAVTSVHGTRWMNELKIMCEGAEAKLATGQKELTRPLNFMDNDNQDKPQLHEGDLYLCSESLNALEGALGGVLDAVDAVFDPSAPNRAFVAIRPPGHHCSDDYPSGFCWVNNVHVGISHASAVHGLTHAAIIDFDLHHGDGSQSITWAHNARVASLPRNAPFSKRTAIGYFSLHDINSYPCEYGDEEKVKNASLCVENAHGQTIWNVHLQTWKTDAEFWKLYETRYLTLLEKTRTFLENHRDRLQGSNNSPQPRAAIFVSAGFDASEWEGQGMQRHKVNVPTDFYARFTRDINNLAQEEGLGVDGRVISVLEGGYSDRALTSGVLSHLSGMKNNSLELSDKVNNSSRIGNDPSYQEDKGKPTEMNPNSSQNKQIPDVSVDPSWWSPLSLEELENVLYPPVPTAPKKPRGPINPTYTTPTQSYSAKVVNPSARRSFSGSTNSAVFKQPSVDLPPPEVGWATAVHELSKILIPDRQTRSCKPEDLNAKATEARRNRQSSMGVHSVPQADEGKKMQLRGRRSKAPAKEIEARPSSRTSRRQTIGGLEAGNDGSSEQIVKAPRRRVSIASTVLSTAEEGVEEPQDQQRPVSRRLSSTSIPRSSSALSSRAAAPIEKSRKPRSPPKQRVPKKIMTATNPSVARSTSLNSTNSTKASTSEPGDVDALANGVKKMSIKLNVNPKPESGAAKAKAVRAPRKTTGAPKVSKKVATSQAGSTSLPVVAETEDQPPKSTTQPIGPVIESTLKAQNEVQQQPLEQPTVSGLMMKAPASSNAVGHSRDQINHGQQPSVVEPLPAPFDLPDQNEMPPSFLAPGPDVIPAPVAKSPVYGSPPSSIIPPSGTVPGVKPNAISDNPSNASNDTISAPGPNSTPKHTRHDLPNFTSTSPILFGPPKGAAQSMGQALATEAETHSSFKSEHDTAVVKEENNGSKDIWDFPPTPQQRMP